MKKWIITLGSAILAMSLSLPAMADHDKKEMRGLISEKTAMSLKLDDKQKLAWRNSQEQLKKLRTQAKKVSKDEWKKIKKIVNEEAKKTNPDLGKVEKAKMDLREKMTQFSKQRKRIEMDFYNTLTPEQKQKVFSRLRERMDKYAEAFQAADQDTISR